ncbi:sigma-70 family RNA polymerase sigma factor [Nakamurella leprariae]|uniref:Sigma-70 family RNA polymerase sigma factor n=1 Tax=Nakamurella leprariae TaxID=2803911 RepID=A0A938YAX6_9ACTN|nr:sigma-70 family RNA polymerase sigma factor [Nakamurella leprariae]MBM9469140.1 sigma-70 family RNA polymerase sigma factor [Nakamurella leprariae]
MADEQDASAGNGGSDRDLGVSPVGSWESQAGLWLTEVAAGDRQAFRALFLILELPVRRAAFRVVRDSGLAEEISQEVFLHVWREAGQFDCARGSAIGWIMMITHHRAVDRVRGLVSSRRRDAVAESAHQDRDHDQVVEDVLTRADRRLVRASMETLTPLQRQCIELVYFSGLTNHQVSRLLAVPLGTVKTRLRDGLGRLRVTLGAATTTGTRPRTTTPDGHRLVAPPVSSPPGPPRAVADHHEGRGVTEHHLGLS